MQRPIDIDDRVPSYDQPLTSRTMLCHYRMVRATPTMAVLVHGPNRCSASFLLKTVHANWGQAVPVPAPGPHRLVFVRIGGVRLGALERVTALFWKPAMRYVILNGGVPNRLVEATAPDGLKVWASAGAGCPAPFSIAPGAKTIAVAKGGNQQPLGGHPVTYAFYTESVGSAT
jgi:hypothetical protein